MAQPTSALAVPEVLYTRFSNADYKYTQWEDLVNNLFGNPNGMGVSAVPYVYAVSADQRRRMRDKSSFYLRVQFRWPSNGKFADEGGRDPLQTYDKYYKSNYLGVIRKFASTRMYVVLEPLRFIESITDEVKDKLLLKQRLPPLPPEELSVHQDRLDTLIENTIGKNYTDETRDYFCLSEIARRSHRSVPRVERDVSKIIGRIEVHPASGCWMSSRKSDYKRTFWLALGGIQVHNLYFFPSESDIKKT